MIDYLNPELIARAISHAAEEQRYADIETIIDQHRVAASALAELRPLLWDYLPIEQRKELNELREVDILLDQWVELKPRVPTEDSGLNDDILESFFRLTRDVQRIRRNMETDVAIRQMDELERDMKATFPG